MLSRKKASQTLTIDECSGQLSDDMIIQVMRAIRNMELQEHEFNVGDCIEITIRVSIKPPRNTNRKRLN